MSKKRMKYFLISLIILGIAIAALGKPQQVKATAYNNIGGSFMSECYGSIWFYNNSTYSSWRLTDGANVWHENGKIDVLNKNFKSYNLSSGKKVFVDLIVYSDDYSDTALFGGYGANSSGLYIKTWGGRPYQENQTGQIYLNDYVMWNTKKGKYFTDTQIKHTIAHEFGHSLGLGHNPYEGNIMKQGFLNYITIGRDDNDSYEARWGRNSFWGGGY